MNEVTLCIVTYNSSEYIVKCIKSALESKLISEVIIVDNNSSDNTIQQIKDAKFKDLKILENKKNLGYPCAVNQCVRLASQEIILLSNPDMIFTEHSIAAMKALLLSKQNIGLIGIRQSYFDGSPQHIFDMYPGVLDGFLRVLFLDKLVIQIRKILAYRDITLLGQYIDGAVHMFPKKVFEKVNGYDEEYFLYCEDVDFCHNIKLNGYSYLRVNENFVYHARGGSSTQTSKKNFYFEQLINSKVRFIKKYHSKIYLYIYLYLERFLLFRSYLAYKFLYFFLKKGSFLEKRDRMLQLYQGILNAQEKRH